MGEPIPNQIRKGWAWSTLPLSRETKPERGWFDHPFPLPEREMGVQPPSQTWKRGGLGHPFPFPERQRERTTPKPNQKGVGLITDSPFQRKRGGRANPNPNQKGGGLGHPFPFPEKPNQEGVGLITPFPCQREKGVGLITDSRFQTLATTRVINEILLPLIMYTAIRNSIQYYTIAYNSM